jgi:hypothetical protein
LEMPQGFLSWSVLPLSPRVGYALHVLPY